MRGLAALAFLAITGCQSMDSSELAWQSLHAVDVAQTLNAADDPCYIESYSITQAMIGKQPSDGEVLAWGIGTAVAHWWVSRTLERREAPQWLQKVWSLGTISHTGYTIANNYDNGVRAFGDNRPVLGCTP